MTVLILDSYTRHAEVVKQLSALLPRDLLYYADLVSTPLDERDGFSRVSRMLTLLDAHLRGGYSVAVLLGKGMSAEPRGALDEGARRAGVTLIHGVDLLADHVSAVRTFDGVCVIGDSCLTRAALQPRLGARELFEIPSPRIEPMYPLDEPLWPILRSWGRSAGTYVLALPEVGRVARQLAREQPGVAIVDEHEHLALALAERLPTAASPRLRVYVTERTPLALTRLRSVFGDPRLSITGLERLESCPSDGPFSFSLDFFGQP